MGKNFEAIESSLINGILTVQPSIDIKVGSITRDIFIDPQAQELQDLYSLADYAYRAQSILTAKSDQLDRLMYNNYVTRFPAKRSTTSVTLNIRNGVSAPTILNVGDQYYTTPDQTGAVLTFANLRTTIITPGQTQVTIPVVCLTPGVVGNVPAQSITQHNYDFVDTLTNVLPADGGADIESDAAFALRSPAFVTGSSLNTYNGMLKSLYSVSNVVSTPYVVTPDNALSRGPYTTDVYLKRVDTYFGTSVKELAPANLTLYTFLQQPLYELNPINQISYINPTTNATVIVPQILNGATQFTIINNPTDGLGFFKGSTKAGQQLKWVIAPPIYPYTIDYNVDQTIIDSQTNYNATNEMTADTLFRQAQAIPVYISGTLSTRKNINAGTTLRYAQNNLNALFSNLQITDALTPNNVVYGLLSDSNLVNINLTNLDTTYQITLSGTYNAGIYSFAPTAPSASVLSSHLLTPLSVLWNGVASTPALGFPIASQLYIGNPNVVTTAGIVPLGASRGTGVGSQNMINGVTTSWNTSVDQFFDSTTGTLVLNFYSAPPAPTATVPNPTISFNIIQPRISTPTGISYLTIAPPLVQPLVLLPSTATSMQQQYATVLPNGLTSTRALVYKNGIALAPSADQVSGDYVLTGPDNNGVYLVKFITPVVPTDILQFGLQNPDLRIV